VSFPRFRTAILVGGALGIVLPIALFLLAYAMRSEILAEVMMLLTPGYYLIDAAERLQHPVPGYAALPVACIANALIYAAGLAIMWCTVWVFRAWRASLRDGTTI
jgi:hypothetical protein